MPCVSSKMAENRSVASIVWRPQRLAWSSASLNSSLVDGATRSVAPGDARQQAKMLFERLQDLVRVQLQVAHDLPERVPLDLGERQTQVLVGEQRVFAPAGFVERAIHDALGRLSQLVLRDVEVLHDALQRIAARGESKMRGQPAAGRRIQPMPVNCLTPNGE